MHDIAGSRSVPRQAFLRASTPRGRASDRDVDISERQELAQQDRQGLLVGGPYNDWLRYWAGRVLRRRGAAYQEMNIVLANIDYNGT